MGKKMASIFCPKAAYFWNAARTVRSPGFLGLALQRAVVEKVTGTLCVPSAAPSKALPLELYGTWNVSDTLLR
jgi:hypothetical protein